MQLSDLLSNAQIDAMRSVATAPELHTTYAPSLGPTTVDFFIKIAGQFGCICDRQYWASIENAVVKRGRWMAHYTDGEVVVTDLDFTLDRNAPTTLWRMGEWLKAGEGIVLIMDGRITNVGWHNWKRIYATLSGHKDTNVYDPELTYSEKTALRISRSREKMFDDARAVNTRKKSGKGRSMSFDEHRAVYRRVERVTREARVTHNARLILESI